VSEDSGHTGRDFKPELTKCGMTTPLIIIIIIIINIIIIIIIKTAQTGLALKLYAF
jgi:hypothetical protein